MVDDLHADEVLFLTDLEGSTPYNLCCKRCGGKSVVLSGMNLPMLMKLATANREHGRADARRGAAGDRAQEHPDWSDEAAVTVVIAAHNYPGPPRTGDEITGLLAAQRIPGVEVLHAGTRRDGDAVVSSGGRVLSVTAVGADLDVARARAYEAVDLIGLAGSHHRLDIAARAAAGDIHVP